MPQEFEWWVKKRKGLNWSQLHAVKSSCLILQYISQKEVYLWAVRDLNAVQIGQSQYVLVSQIFIFYNNNPWFPSWGVSSPFFIPFLAFLLTWDSSDTRKLWMTSLQAPHPVTHHCVSCLCCFHCWCLWAHHHHWVPFTHQAGPREQNSIRAISPYHRQNPRPLVIPIHAMPPLAHCGFHCLPPFNL